MATSQVDDPRWQWRPLVTRKALRGSRKKVLWKEGGPPVRTNSKQQIQGVWKGMGCLPGLMEEEGQEKR